MADMDAKGRRGRAALPRGEGHPGAKITAVHAAAIRVDPRPTRAIAADYGITSSTVNRIKVGKLWREP
jgi:hypothetical protein